MHIKLEGRKRSDSGKNDCARLAAPAVVHLDLDLARFRPSANNTRRQVLVYGVIDCRVLVGVTQRLPGLTVE